MATIARPNCLSRSPCTTAKLGTSRSMVPAMLQSLANSWFYGTNWEMDHVRIFNVCETTIPRILRRVQDFAIAHDRNISWVGMSVLWKYRRKKLLHWKQGCHIGTHQRRSESLASHNMQPSRDCVGWCLLCIWDSRTSGALTNCTITLLSSKKVAIVQTTTNWTILLTGLYCI